MRSRSWAAGALILSLSIAPAVSRAAALDPAAAQVEAFNAELSQALKADAATPAKLKPAVEKLFNLTVMAQFAVGAPWNEMSSANRAAVVAALARYTAARYARDLRTAHDAVFSVDPAVQVRGPDKLVKAEVRTPGETPDHLIYRMRDYGGTWRAVDVFQDGVSELATQRADFTSALEKGGAPALIRKLDEATARLR